MEPTKETDSEQKIKSEDSSPSSKSEKSRSHEYPVVDDSTSSTSKSGGEVDSSVPSTSKGTDGSRKKSKDKTGHHLVVQVHTSSKIQEKDGKHQEDDGPSSSTSEEKSAKDERQQLIVDDSDKNGRQLESSDSTSSGGKGAKEFLGTDPLSAMSEEYHARQPTISGLSSSTSDGDDVRRYAVAQLHPYAPEKQSKRTYRDIPLIAITEAGPSGKEDQTDERVTTTATKGRFVTRRQETFEEIVEIPPDSSSPSASVTRKSSSISRGQRSYLLSPEISDVDEQPRATRDDIVFKIPYTKREITIPRFSSLDLPVKYFLISIFGISLIILVFVIVTAIGVGELARNSYSMWHKK